MVMDVLLSVDLRHTGHVLEQTLQYAQKIVKITDKLSTLEQVAMMVIMSMEMVAQLLA